MVLGTIGMLLSAGAISGIADKHSKKANPTLNNHEFDAKCARFGINRVKIMDIAARCGVRPSKYGVLPEDGWKNCIKYISKYANHPNDIEQFKRNWKYVVEQQLKNKSQQIINQYWEQYQITHQAFLKHKKYWLGGPIIVLELRHWHGLPKDEHIKRMEDIQKNTLWGELIAQKPILRHNPRIEDAHIEVWTLHGTEKDKQDSHFTMKQKKRVYKECCGVCGYDPML